MEDDKRECPFCKSKNIELVPHQKTFDELVYINRCKDCGRRFSQIVIISIILNMIKYCFEYFFTKQSFQTPASNKAPIIIVAIIIAKTI